VLSNILAGRIEGNRPFGRPRRSRENNITMDLREIVGGCGLDSSASG
jgi:hypothetical protein